MVEQTMVLISQERIESNIQYVNILLRQFIWSRKRELKGLPVTTTSYPIPPIWSRKRELKAGIVASLVENDISWSRKRELKVAISLKVIGTASTCSDLARENWKFSALFAIPLRLHITDLARENWKFPASIQGYSSHLLISQERIERFLTPTHPGPRPYPPDLARENWKAAEIAPYDVVVQLPLISQERIEREL